MMQYNWRKLCG